MSFKIDSLGDLQWFLKKQGLKVDSVEQLQELLRTVQATYNPDATRVQAARTMAVTVSSVALGSAGVATFVGLPVMLADHHGPSTAAIALGLTFLAILWIVAGSVSGAVSLSCIRFISRLQAGGKAVEPEAGILGFFLPGEKNGVAAASGIKGSHAPVTKGYREVP